MSEGGEGVPVPVEAKKVQLDKYGQIPGEDVPKNPRAETAYVDPDDSDTDTRSTSERLEELRGRLDKAEPFDVNQLRKGPPEVAGTPIVKAPNVPPVSAPKNPGK